jgi:hypothetical protein
MLLLQRAGIVLFCIWHMVAVAVFVIPAQAQGTATQALREHVLPIVRPYLLITSQWQNWDLFSPDPMRRTTRYRVDALTAGFWKPVKILEPALQHFWRSDEFSYVIRLEDGGVGVEDLWLRYVRALCAPLGLPEATPVRLVVEYAILPASAPAEGWEAWRGNAANWFQWQAAITPCPAPDDPSVIPFSHL